MSFHFFAAIFLAFNALVSSHNPQKLCRSFCGNLTIDYPFALQPGCGHQAFRQLLFCIENVLMLHISSGSYRVLDIDYAYETIVLHDPHMSTCDSITLGRRGNGFVVEPWRAKYLGPTADNVFMLLGCSANSPLFRGLSGKHSACSRDVLGLGCEEYYRCGAWEMMGRSGEDGSMYRSDGYPECCATSVKVVNLTSLSCEGYASAFSVAPLKVGGPEEWAYGIRVKYVQENRVFCGECEATGGSCGYDSGKNNSDLCLCGSWNSTSNCDSVYSGSYSWRIEWIPMVGLMGLYVLLCGDPLSNTFEIGAMQRRVPRPIKHY